MPRKIEWLAEPERHDYDAALSFLSLPFTIQEAGAMVHALREAPIEHWKAKDIMRASGLEVLDERNSHVEHNLKKIEDGKKLSPILLVRNAELIIADGYHRVCSVYLHDEDAPIPCKITGAPE